MPKRSLRDWSKAPRKSGGPPKSSLTEAAYRAIKDEIVANRLRPGEPVPKGRLVRALKLSLTPIREALLRLEKEGFIEVKPRLGTFVSHLNLREIQEMYQVRSTLEGLAARLAAGAVEPEHLAAVEHELRKHAVSGKVNYRALSEAGQGLHRMIIESCGNGVLTRHIQSLQDHFKRFRSLSLNIPEKILSSHQEHLCIPEAVKRGDGPQAERLIHKHFEHAARFLLDNLLSRSNRHRDLVITVPMIG